MTDICLPLKKSESPVVFDQRNTMIGHWTYAHASGKLYTVNSTVLDACCGFRTDRNITSCNTTKWISISYGCHSWGRRPVTRILCMKHRGQWKSIFPCVEMNYSRSKIEQRFRFVCRSPQSAEWKTPNAAHENFNRNNDKRDCKMEEFPRFFRENRMGRSNFTYR